MSGLVRFLVACALALVAVEAVAGEQSWELHLPGYSHHFSSPQQPGRHWADLHDGLGLQRTTRNDDTVVRFTAGFMRDSFDNQGLYAGGAIGVRLLRGDVEVDVSAAPMLLYRTTRFDDAHGPAPLKLIPVVMPLLSFEHRASGIGANLTVLPGGNFGKDLQFPGLVFIQLTYRLR
jgi:hypothetical protein